jgi:hypothetical protein
MPRLVQPPDELVRFWQEKYEQDLRKIDNGENNCHYPSS